jgi:hypothetical protein
MMGLEIPLGREMKRLRARQVLKPLPVCLAFAGYNTDAAMAEAARRAEFPGKRNITSAAL